MKRKIEVEIEIGECDACHFRGIDGGPGAVMVCDYPGAEDSGYIISWNDKRTKRISTKCPLRIIYPEFPTRDEFKDKLRKM